MDPRRPKKPAPAKAQPAEAPADALERAVEFVRREERRRCAEQLREMDKHAYFEGKEEGYHEGYRAGYRKGWSEAKGDPRLAEFYGQSPDERAWARGVLHVAPDADAEAIQKAYKDLARYLHPDVNPKAGERYFSDLARAKALLLGED